MRKARIEHSIHLLQLRADERQKLQLDPSYIPAPVLEERLTHSFRVSSLIAVKYVSAAAALQLLSHTYPRNSDTRIYLKEVEFC